MTLFPLPYLPPVSWCAAAWDRDRIVIEAWENYQKGSVRNRCYIAGPNGIQRLSIPLVKGKHRQTPIREVRISRDEPWQRQHWRSISTAYGNAPFFEHYAGAVAVFYEKRYEFLFDFNLDLLTFIFQKKLGWSGEITLSNAYFPAGSWPHGADLRAQFEGEPAACPQWFRPARYAQVFEERHGFLPNLSVLDLLFCCGKRGGETLAGTAAV